MQTVCAQIARLLKPDGSFFLNIAGSSSQPWLPFELITRLRDLFVLQNHIVWIKSVAIDEKTYGHFKPVNSPRFINHNHEHVFHLTHRGDVRLERLAAGVPFTDKTNIARRSHSIDRRCRGNTWFIPYETVRHRREKFLHPGTFPVALPSACLTLHGYNDDTVLLDPFMGTGTSLVAAQELGVRGRGYRYRYALCRGRTASASARAGRRNHGHRGSHPLLRTVSGRRGNALRRRRINAGSERSL